MTEQELELFTARFAQCLSEITAFLSQLKSQGVVVPQSLCDAVEAAKECTKEQTKTGTK